MISPLGYFPLAALGALMFSPPSVARRYLSLAQRRAVHCQVKKSFNLTFLFQKGGMPRF